VRARSPCEAAQAAEAAQQAFAVYSQTTPQQQARFLCAIADELDALGAAGSIASPRRWQRGGRQ
jgi:acyl-CoA reductase-like NAD-dependent aldehyde dehydrogenase